MEFNWKIYKELNRDLNLLLKTKQDCIKHYELYGKNQGRLKSILDVHKDFNIDCYRYNYDDLCHSPIEDIELHYLLFSYKEGRICNRKVQRVYIISKIDSGGCLKYIKDLIDGFPDNKYIIIRSKKDFLACRFRNSDIVLIQHLLFTTITPKDFLGLKKKIGFRLIICIHDFYWLNKDLWNYKVVNPHSRYLETKEILPEVKELFNYCDRIIHPSRFTFDNYSRYVDNGNFIIVPHNDVEVKMGIRNIPKIIDNKINIGFLHEFGEVKGGEYIVKLFEKYKKYKDYDLNYLVIKKNIRPYLEEEYYEYIENLNIHCLTFLSKWGETWSYSLSKALNSGLPIIYNNLGVFKERIPKMDHYFLVHEKEGELDDHEKLYEVFEKMLDYIIENNGYKEEMKRDMKIVYQDYYRELLGG